MISNELIDIDLPSLQSIQLGYEALYGSYDQTCSLTMRSKNEMIKNKMLCRSSKSNVHRF